MTGSIVMRSASDDSRGKMASTLPFSAGRHPASGAATTVTARAAIARASGSPSASARGAPPVTRSGRLASSVSSRAMLFSSSRIRSVLSR